MQEFRTTNGRPVREGNGIEPDVALPAPARSDLERALISEAAFFRFADVLASEDGDLIRAAAQRTGRLELPDDAWPRFRSWLEEDSFSFRSDLGQQVLEIEALKRSDADAAVQELGRLAAADVEQAFEDARDTILGDITDELAARLLDPHVRVQALLDADTALLEALDVVSSNRYAALLGIN